MQVILAFVFGVWEKGERFEDMFSYICVKKVKECIRQVSMNALF